MRFVYSVNALREFFDSSVAPIYSRAIDACNAEHKDLKSMAFWMSASSIDITLKCRRLSACNRFFIARCIDDVVPLTPDAKIVFKRFHEMVMARR